MDFVCSECGKRVSIHTMQPKCECGGLWDLDFVPPPVLSGRYRQG